MAKASDPRDVGAAKVLEVSEKALRVSLKSGREVWVPKEALHTSGGIKNDSKEGDSGKLIVLVSWARSNVSEVR